MPEHGMDLSYETTWRRTVKFGPLIARAPQKRQPRPGDVWRSDGAVVKVAGRSDWFWRAVDQHRIVLEARLQSRRDKHEAKHEAKREVAPALGHCSHKGRNNRAKNSHLPL